MVNIIDMKDMRYINLFGRIAKVNTRYCFMYNEAVIFAVPRRLVSKAIGRNGENVKKISEILGRKIKIIAMPQGIEDAREFINSIISPVTFKSLEITGDEIIITGGSHNKAALIGRYKKRLAELKNIVKDFFKKELRIV